MILPHASIDVYWDLLRGALFEATDRGCEWTKVPGIHREIMIIISSNRNDISNINW